MAGKRLGGEVDLEPLERLVRRVHEATKLPPLPPTEYGILFGLIANKQHDEKANGIVRRARLKGFDLAEKDVRFVLHVVESMGVAARPAAEIAGSYCTYIIAKCREVGLELELDDLRVLEIWFTTRRSVLH